jgi:protein SCO1/2
LINATLVVVSNDAYLQSVKKVGNAPLEKPPADAPVASSGFELIKEGQPVPNVNLVDENGRKFDLEAYRGKAVAITFMYTKCPMPTFCPMMDRNFASVQTKLKDERIQQKVQLLSVSIDPIVDTPPVLKKHASELKADPTVWTFATGDRDDIDQFAARFGLTVTRSQTDQRDITHTLRTAIVDAQGNLVKVYVGNEWTPDQAFADLKAVAGGN